MSQQKSSAPLVGITIAAMAVVFATSLFLGVLYLRSRTSTTPTDPITGPTTANTDVEGKNVQYTIYPDEEVRLVPVDAGSGDKSAANITPSTPIPPTAVPPTATPTPEKIIFTNYTVKSGDTLYSIAAHYGWNSTISLMAKHNIAADHIVPGVVLTRFPIANSAFCPGSRTYVVEESESASTIARTAGTTIEILKEMNNLDEAYTVKVTDVLCVP